MTHLLILLFVSAFTLNALGQERFSQAYYIDSKSDTIEGFIKNQNQFNNGFSFKPALNSKKKFVSVNDAKAFTFRSGNAYRQINLSPKDQPSEIVFGKILIDGTVDFYMHQGKLFLTSDKGVFPLSKNKRAVDGEINYHYQKNLGYFNILFHDCAEVYNRSKSITIQQNQVAKLVQNYHECLKQPFTIHKGSVKRAYQIGFVVGSVF